MPLAGWEGSVVDLKRGEVAAILGTLLRSGQFLALTACDVVGWALLATTLMGRGHVHSQGMTCQAEAS